MVKNIIDNIAMDLTRLKYESDYFRSNEKLFTRSGIILEPYAKFHNISAESLQNLIKSNSFFKLDKSTIQTGLFAKRDKLVDVIKWEDYNTLRSKYNKNSDKVLKESSASPVLTESILNIISEERAMVEQKPKFKSIHYDFNYPQEDRGALYKKYFPDEFEKYQREGRTESNLEKKFMKKVVKGSEFRFSDGKVAYNLLTWFQCLQMAPNDIIVDHLKNKDFYNWLDTTVKAPELSRICLILEKSILSNEITEKEVKKELLKSISNSSLNNIIFETIILPILRKLKSNDQATVEEAVDKLLTLGDSRVVEPLMARIFDSQTPIRHKIIIGLGKLGDKRITPTLIKILKHSKNTNDRLLALKTLSAVQDRRALSTLQEIAKGKDEVGNAAELILKEMKNR